VDEIRDFGLIVLAVSGGVTLAVVTSKLSERFAVPSPALFLLAAAVASDLFPGLAEPLTFETVERIGVVAIIVILFDGGMHVGWRRFRGSLVPISLLGVAGTFATAAAIALCAHGLLDFDWTTAWIIGAALAPTDPAVMFSVLGGREVGGRTGTILEGESGVNDPVGIALLIGVVEFATADDASGWTILWDFSLQMAIGLAVGVLGAATLVPLMQRFTLPREGLYSIRVLAAGFVIYGLATVLDGSGFLAVFVTGLLIGDVNAPYKGEIERFHTALASLAEIAVFVALGLTIDLTEIFKSGHWVDGLVLAVLLAFVARPLALALLLLPARLRRGERIFVMWSGLRGAVPILLAALVVLANVDDANRVYDIVFVVVAFSVLVQGSTIPFVAARLGVPMRTVEPEPFDLSIRLREHPEDARRFVVGEHARAVGHSIRDLPLGERTWISLIVRDGQAHQARGSHVFQPGDELHVLTSGDEVALQRLFEGRRASALPSEQE
jgi:cell volume regulation protein A